MQTAHYKIIMYKLLLPILCLLFSHVASAISLSASVDRTTISSNETLLLTVVLDRQGADKIDVSALEIEFDILQRRQGSQTSIINGRISAKTQWIFVLAPKTSGDLLIPSLSSLGAFSEPIKIQVSDNKQAANGKPTSKTNSDVFLEASIDKNTVYVQEQILYTLRLFYRVSLSGYTAEDIAVNNSTIELSHENNYQKSVNGVPYNVLERSYVIHPQASGQISIPAQTWQIERATSRFGTIKSPYLRVNSQEQTIKVLPVANASTAKNWLPASQLTLKQQWQQSTITAKVGEPLTYALTLSAKGLGHSQLPTIDITNTDDFTVYSDPAKTDNQLGPDGITGTRTSHYAVIPKAAGTYQLPPVTIKWWNINTDKEELITLEPQRVIVANSEIEQENTLDIPTTPQSNTPVSNTPVASTHWGWIVSTVSFGILAILFFVLWRLSVSSIKSTPKKNSDSSVKAPSLKTTYHQIEQAIDGKAWHSIKPLLQQWASIKANAVINSNDDIVQYFPDLEQALIALDKQLYSEGAIVVWDFKQLVPLLKQQKLIHAHKEKGQTLADLYPH